MSSESRDWRRDRASRGGRGRGASRPGRAPSPPSRASAPPPAPSKAVHAASAQHPSLADAAPIRGECARMCSEREQREREDANEISRFERAAGSGAASAVLAVKKYRRAAAGATTLDPSEVRPPRVLLATLTHLLRVVLPREGGGFALEDDGADSKSVETASNFLALYEFLSDRIRSVRQDFTVQHVEDASLEAALEQIARFYALAGLRAVQVLDFAGGGDKMRALAAYWSDKLHDEQLASALAQLMELYRVQHASGGAGALGGVDRVLDRQAEFVALDLLLRLEDARGVALALRRMPARLRGRERVRRALRAFVALQLGDFRDFVGQFEAMEVLEQALALRMLPRVWADALRMLNKALGKQDRVDLGELGVKLSLIRNGEDVAVVEQLCLAMNIHTERVEGGEAPLPSSWEQQDSTADAVASAVFARFKVSQPNVELEKSEARKLMRSVALRRVRRTELEAGGSVAELVTGS